MGKQRRTDSGLPRGPELPVATKGPICGFRDSNDRGYICAKNPGHLGSHTMVRDDGVIATHLQAEPDSTLVIGNNDVLPAAAAPAAPGGQATADPTPPDVPGESGDAPESSSQAAGSGDGGAGRPLFADSTDNKAKLDALEKQMVERRVAAAKAELEKRQVITRPDASEKVLGAAMGVINPADDPAFAIRHAEESARVLIIGQHFAEMLKAIAPPVPQLVAEKDVRGIYHWLRLIAATHGLDLNDEGAGS